MRILLARSQGEAVVLEILKGYQAFTQVTRNAFSSQRNLLIKVTISDA